MTARDNDRLVVPLVRLITETRVAIQKAFDDCERVFDNIYHLFTHVCDHRRLKMRRFLRSTNGISKLKWKVHLRFDLDR